MGGKTVSFSVNKDNRSAINTYEQFEVVTTEMVITEISGGFVLDDYRMDFAFLSSMFNPSSLDRTAKKDLPRNDRTTKKNKNTRCDNSSCLNLTFLSVQSYN